MRKICLSFSLVLIIGRLNLSYSQDYTIYYQQVDSANGYSFLKNYAKADSIYNRCLLNFIGFPDDYSIAIRNYYKLNKSLNKEFVIKAFQSGLHIKDLKYQLDFDSITYSKREIKKLYKKNRIKRSVRVMPILRMLIKDQKNSRKGGPEAVKRDSLNAIKLIKLYKSNPDIFNRFKTGGIWSFILEPIIFHQRWVDIEPIFYDLRNLVKKGYLRSYALSYLIDRNSLYGGHLYKLDTASQKMNVILRGNDTICSKRFRYSNLGVTYKYNRELNKYYLIPLNSHLTKNEINQLRAFLFLPTLDFYLASYPYLSFPSVEEYCKYISIPRNPPKK